MIVVETVLREIFAQLPDIDYAGKLWPVKFHWGNQDDLNLYMKTESGNQTPLIWLVEGDSDNLYHGNVRRNIRLIIAKSSENKGERNPIVWDSEFAEVLNPLSDNVYKALSRNGKTQVLSDAVKLTRRANYSEGEDKTKTIDHWNVIVMEFELLILPDGYCVKENINFY